MSFQQEGLNMSMEDGKQATFAAITRSSLPQRPPINLSKVQHSSPSTTAFTGCFDSSQKKKESKSCRLKFVDDVHVKDQLSTLRERNESQAKILQELQSSQIKLNQLLVDLREDPDYDTKSRSSEGQKNERLDNIQVTQGQITQGQQQDIAEDGNNNYGVQQHLYQDKNILERLTTSLG